MRFKVLAGAVLVCVVCAACGGSTHSVTEDGVTFSGVAKTVTAPLVTYKVPAGAMLPTLQVGANILVAEERGTLRLGEVIVFHPPRGVESYTAECGSPKEGISDEQAPLSEPCDQPTAGESSETLIKRVVGLPGDTLKITKGHVIRNGVAEKEPYITACGTASECTFARSFTVPAGDVYVLGDNRGNSDDSRYWGPEPEKWVIGPVVACVKGTRYCHTT